MTSVLQTFAGFVTQSLPSVPRNLVLYESRLAVMLAVICKEGAHMAKLLTVAALCLTCAAGPVLAQDLKAALEGKTLSAGKNTLTLAKSGKMTGVLGGKDKLSGAWAVRDGKFCRTLEEPKRFAGTECQSATVKGNVLRVTNAAGKTTEWVIN
jgi:hypothetical protein